MLRKWDDLPDFMMTSQVRPYYETLDKKRAYLHLKRAFDILASLILLLLLSLPMLVIALMIKADSSGPVFYRQERVTTCGKVFRIHKFRTMIDDAEKKGTTVTVKDDSRITNVGRKLRRVRLDEIPQLIDVLKGDMTLVGTRPEALKYVERYEPEYYATLLLPAGVTSEASIRFRDEDRLLSEADDVDRVYLEKILPQKMKWNLRSMKELSMISELCTMLRTVIEVFR